MKETRIVDVTEDKLEAFDEEIKVSDRLSEEIKQLDAKIKQMTDKNKKHYYEDKQDLKALKAQLKDKQ